MLYAYITKLVRPKIHPRSAFLDKQQAYEE